MVNISNWTLINQDTNNATFTRTCTNIDNSTECNSLQSNETTQILPWTKTNTCSKPCDTGTGTKSITFNNQTFTSNIIPCNTETCTSMVNYGNWINNSTNNAIIRQCINKDTTRDACSILPITQLNIQNIYPPSAVPQGSQTTTINNITYTFTNDGCNGLNAAWTFDKNNDTWTRAPFSEWYLFGSNNGTSWTQLDYQNLNLPNNTGVHFVFNNNISYSYYRFVISKSGKLSNNTYSYAPNIEFYLFNVNQ